MFLICFGTRPEYIKVQSLINNLKNVKTCFTGQHTDLLQNINVDFSLNIAEQTNNRLNNIIVNTLLDSTIFQDINYVIVQGDTTSALSIALSAFNNKIKVIHLEAGLRTYNREDPYPEELNRQLISRIANIHLCPTELNKCNLIKEGITDNIYVTGNTGLDNIDKTNVFYGNKIIITLHRRDNHDIMNKWFEVIEKLANTHSELKFILPIHPNPNVQKHRNILNKVIVIDPLNHNEMINLLKECKFIISDSGGIQEEASFLNKRIIICRKDTERPEVLETHGILCDSPNKLENIFNDININYIVDKHCPFGNGKSYKNIIDIIETF
jgi:UDP-N-acetylglucosamine 2-epimerase (non-hydrolysing)